MASQVSTFSLLTVLIMLMGVINIFEVILIPIRDQEGIWVLQWIMSVLCLILPPIGLRVFYKVDYKLLAFYCFYLWIRIWWRIAYCLIIFTFDESDARRAIYAIDTALELLVVIPNFIYGARFLYQYQAEERTVKL
eukprot:TRINITY_DN7142_c0_g1_i1.p1 TRINITY_DN7142_c0_g1~~TRINITY_DN7142_c0_g1_i1.p1  ORF type:complete len:136 (+),score=20.70 TRINITY_DN7142_c0_g1_i1:78-485(+)